MNLPAWLARTPKVPTPPLLQAVRDGRIEDLSALIQAGEDVNVRAPDGSSPLHVAATHVWPDALKLLLKAGADITARDKGGRTPAHQAADQGRTENLEILLHAGSPIDDRDRNWWAAAHHAASGGHVDTIQLLIARGADRSLQDVYGRSPVIIAGKNDHPEVVALFSPTPPSTP